MANEQNFPDGIQDSPNLRPRRISDTDRVLVQEKLPDESFAEKEVVFGQTQRDLVEINVYDELNNLVGRQTLLARDEALRLLAFTSNAQVGVGQDQTPDVLQIDFKDVLKRMGSIDPETGDPIGLPPGRYTVSVNVFRNEIGEEFGGTDRRMFIKEIAPSRKEIRLLPVFGEQRIANEISEFIDPSVPKFVGQAIIDQTFGFSLDVDRTTESVTFQALEVEISRLDSEAGREGDLRTASRLNRSELQAQFYNAFLSVIPQMRDRILDFMVEGDLQIQDVEMRQFIRQGVGVALIDAVVNGEVDPRLLFLDRSGVSITP